MLFRSAAAGVCIGVLHGLARAWAHLRERRQSLHATEQHLIALANPALYSHSRDPSLILKVDSRSYTLNIKDLAFEEASRL